jgi:catechol 2,3-dioxygenase-like lactoylglutathione lyase family enzyme
MIRPHLPGHNFVVFIQGLKGKTFVSSQSKMILPTRFVALSLLIMVSGQPSGRQQKTITAMEQRLSIITIGADNLPAMKAFYMEKFGWKPVAENKDILFFKLNGILFGLFGRKDMAKFNGASPEGSGFRPYNLAYMVDSKEKVVELYDLLKSRGVKIISEPEVPSFGGYYFLIADLEGNIWEIAWNLFMPLDGNGNVITHKPIDNL